MSSTHNENNIDLSLINTKLIELENKLLEIRKCKNKVKGDELEKILDEEDKCLMKINELKAQIKNNATPVVNKSNSLIQAFNQLNDKAKIIVFSVLVLFGATSAIAINNINDKQVVLADGTTIHKAQSKKNNQLIEFKKNYIKEYKNRYRKKYGREYTGNFKSYERFMATNNKKVLKIIQQGGKIKTDEERTEFIKNYMKKQYEKDKFDPNVIPDREFYWAFANSLRYAMEDIYPTY